MKDLHQLKVEEISQKEKKQVEGGLWYPRVTGPILLLPYLIYKAIE